MQEKTLFIDRDGTLIHEPMDNFQIDSLEKLVFEPHVISVLKDLIQRNFKLVMVTNQDGLYTRGFSYDSFILPHKFMLDTFFSQGVYFHDILVCPHFVSDNCDCRKPKTGLVQYWISNNLLDKKNSYVIGDRLTDLEFAKNIDINGILYNQKTMNWLHIQNILSSQDRSSEICRITKETRVVIKLWLDRSQNSIIHTGIKFFDHMLDQIAVHANITMHINVDGDFDINDHHIIEDTGIVLGKSILKSLRNKHGIGRFGFYVPMDESSSYCLLDLSGRPYLKFLGNFGHQYVNDFSTCMVEHFFRSLSVSMKSTIHLVSTGNDDHHQIESLFKAFGRSLRQAIVIEGNQLPSSKGIL
ncbi:bifunctional histidinol-phosphatase/imidazoleglycerol-phosphate dehydratase HisB [Buchnera aphidicola]|uniref:bifunctional histidinol-phosphatase/imidazoleglycerol-phosphate dehydratase HisB n=1 Tax=Buchnera aphidicola TaxID=9 RepID=UPI0034645488